jgi:hypothetical protein
VVERYHAGLIIRRRRSNRTLATWLAHDVSVSEITCVHGVSRFWLLLEFSRLVR